MPHYWRPHNISMTNQITIEAPAKINLSLSIVGRRPDGYHLLETLMVKLKLADRLTMGLADQGIDVMVSGADLPCGPENLVYRAARLFFQTCGIDRGVRLKLEKRIPVAAGLGGGSSDAAGTLWGLNELCDRPFNQMQLEEMGLRLGADVPFFINRNGACRAGGIGEVLTPGPDMSDLFVLLVNPGWPLSTAWVYKKFNFELTKKRQKHIFCGLLGRSPIEGECLQNDLETVVLPRFPELGRIKQQLLAEGAENTLMSGSGPTIFGTFTNERTLEAAAGRIEEAGQGKWQVVATRCLAASSGLNEKTDQNKT